MPGHHSSARTCLPVFYICSFRKTLSVSGHTETPLYLPSRGIVASSTGQDRNDDTAAIMSTLKFSAAAGNQSAASREPRVGRNQCKAVYMQAPKKKNFENQQPLQKAKQDNLGLNYCSLFSYNERQIP